LHEGRNPYTTDFGPIARKLGLNIGTVWHATDPPTFLLCIKPFASLTVRTAFYVWTGLNALLLVSALMLLVGMSPDLDLSSKLAIAALSLFYVPVAEHFYFGQSKIPVLFLLVLMVRLMENKRDRSAGLCLALAGLLRIFPLLLLGYLLIQRRWQVLAWTLLGLVAGGLITIWLMGVSETLSFPQAVRLISDSRFLSSLGNIALQSFVSNLFWPLVRRNPGVDVIRRIALVAAHAGVLALTLRATLRLSAGDDPDWRGLGLWIVASVLLSPTAWVYDMVLFLVPFVQLAYASSHAAASRRAIVAAGLSYLLVLLALGLVMYAHALDAQYAVRLAQAARSGQPAAALSKVYLIVGLAESWFFSAALTYLATYWLTVDVQPAYAGGHSVLPQ
jgi:hypothetical protein